MQLMPGPPPLSEGMGRAIGHFDEFGLAQDAARMIGVAPPVEVEEKDWSIAWRALHKGRRVGPRSWAGPPWEEAPTGLTATRVRPTGRANRRMSPTASSSLV